MVLTTHEAIGEKELGETETHGEALNERVCSNCTRARKKKEKDLFSKHLFKRCT